jgi:hypothetical protein
MHEYIGVGPVVSEPESEHIGQVWDLQGRCK